MERLILCLLGACVFLLTGCAYATPMPTASNEEYIVYRQECLPGSIVCDRFPVRVYERTQASDEFASCVSTLDQISLFLASCSLEPSERCSMAREQYAAWRTEVGESSLDFLTDQPTTTEQNVDACHLVSILVSADSRHRESIAQYLSIFEQAPIGAVATIGSERPY